MKKTRKVPAPISRDQNVSEALSVILLHHLNGLGQWEDDARSWQSPEGVHQIRVTLRRMRSALSVFRPAIPRKVYLPWFEEMRWLAGQMGDARDLDVFIEEALNDISGKLELPGENVLRELAQHARESAYVQVRSMLDSERYHRFKRNFGDWSSTQEWLKADLKKKKRKRLDSDILYFARQALDRQERRVLSLGSEIDQHSATDMHKLRIECKKLRYAGEFFAPLFPDMETFIQHMKNLQDLLGIMNDVSVMNKLLKNLFQQGSRGEAGRYAGGVVGWRSCEYHRLLESYEEYWNEFTHAKHPWWKKSSSKTD